MRFAILTAFLLSAASAPLHAEDGTSSNAETEKLVAGTILPLLRQKCLARHGDAPQGPQAVDLNFRTHDSLLKRLGLDDNKRTCFHGGHFKQPLQTGGEIIQELPA